MLLAGVLLAVGAGQRELGKWKVLGWWGDLSLTKGVVGGGCWEAGISIDVEVIRAVERSEPKKALEWGTGKCLADIFKNHIGLPRDAAWLCFETDPKLSYRLR